MCGAALRVDRPEFCLRCHGPLKYRRRIHFNLLIRDRYPEPRTIVHAYFDERRGQWNVPRLWLRAGRLNISGVPNHAMSQVIEAEVTEVLKDAEGWVSSLDLAFMRGTSIARANGL